jgi:hypothetical protein
MWKKGIVELGILLVGLLIRGFVFAGVCKKVFAFLNTGSLKTQNLPGIDVKTPPFGGVSSPMSLKLRFACFKHGFTKNTKPTLKELRMGKNCYEKEN